jgi:hypothetical protein
MKPSDHLLLILLKEDDRTASGNICAVALSATIGEQLSGSKICCLCGSQPVGVCTNSQNKHPFIVSVLHSILTDMTPDDNSHRYSSLGPVAEWLRR